MSYREIKQDLFTMPADYALVHCISADFALGAGIALEFQNKFHTRDELKQRCPNYKYFGGDCLGTGTRDTRIVFNLVTKEKYWHKPTYETLQTALIELKQMMFLCHYNKIAMPIIGCGLDGLKWDKVRAMIQEIFREDSIEIIVCMR